MSSSTVALTRLADYSEPGVTNAIRRQFDLLGGLEKFVKHGDKVLLKPNFIAPRSHRYAAQTHPSVIIAVARLLKDSGARPFVGDSPAWSSVQACARVLRLIEPLKKLGVPLRQLDKPRWRQIGNKKMNVGISSHALDADAIINLPKFKSHQQLVATFAIKNMFGCISGKHKAMWHFRKGGKTQDFCEMLIEIYKALAPGVTIIDGVFAMDGQGPIHGGTRPLGWLIGGVDPVACERVCCRLVKLDPTEVPMIETAELLKFGCSDFDDIELLGDAFSEHVCSDFKRAQLTPLRFSFIHVCKSIARQVVLLAKGYREKQSIEEELEG